MHLWHCSALLLCRSNPQVSCGGASCQEHCSWLLTGLSLPPVKPVSSLLMDLLLRWKVSLFTFSCWPAKFISPPFPRRSSSSLHVLMLCPPVIPSSLVSRSALAERISPSAPPLLPLQQRLADVLLSAGATNGHSLSPNQSPPPPTVSLLSPSPSAPPRCCADSQCSSCCEDRSSSSPRLY